MTITHPSESANQVNDVDQWMSIDQLLEKYHVSRVEIPIRGDASIGSETSGIFHSTMAEQDDFCSGGNQQSKPGSKAASARACDAARRGLYMFASRSFMSADGFLLTDRRGSAIYLRPGLGASVTKSVQN